MRRLFPAFLLALFTVFGFGCSTSPREVPLSASIRLPASEQGAAHTRVEVLEINGKPQAPHGALRSIDLVRGHHSIVVRVTHADHANGYVVKGTLDLYPEPGHTYELLPRKESDAVTLIVRDRTPGVARDQRDQRFPTSLEGNIIVRPAAPGMS